MVAYSLFVGRGAVSFLVAVPESFSELCLHSRCSSHFIIGKVV